MTEWQVQPAPGLPASRAHNPLVGPVTQSALTPAWFGTCGSVGTTHCSASGALVTFALSFLASPLGTGARNLHSYWDSGHPVPGQVHRRCQLQAKGPGSLGPCHGPHQPGTVLPR